MTYNVFIIHILGTEIETTGDEPADGGTKRKLEDEEEADVQNPSKKSKTEQV